MWRGIFKEKLFFRVDKQSKRHCLEARQEQEALWLIEVHLLSPEHYHAVPNQPFFISEGTCKSKQP